MMVFIYSIICSILISSISGQPVDCQTVRGVASLPSLYALSSATCPDGYTMTSCGYRSHDADDDGILGSYIEGETCYAVNGLTNRPGVGARARCCDLRPFQLTCSTTESAISDFDTNDRTFIDCDDDETLIGCSARGQGHINGGYPAVGEASPPADTDIVIADPDTCTAQNSDRGDIVGEGAFAYATCCTSSDENVQLQCSAVWGDSGTNEFEIVRCPSPETQFMTSCQGILDPRGTGDAADDTDVNDWQITGDAGSDICVVRNGNTANPARAVAICCEVVTVAPTAFPTLQPTAPTKSPTGSSSSSSSSSGSSSRRRR